ncbi:MAG: PKD domain-containing protein [Atribacterota bacterium]|nr:PKD domain-containing protein [Atribacterota bacterium]
MRLGKNFLFYSGFFFLIFVTCGCTWFSKGIINIFNPEAEVRMYYVVRSFDVGGEGKFDLMNGIVFDLLIYPLNEVGFTIERLEYRYSTKNGPVENLTRNIYLAYYVPPNPYTDQTIPTSTETGPYAIRNLPLVFQEGIDYLWKNYQEGMLFLDLAAFIHDDAGHFIEKQIVSHFPVLEMGEDFFAPEVTVEPAEGEFPTGTTITFVAQAKDDYMVKSYQWIINGVSASGCVGSTQGQTFTHTFSTPGTYSVLVKACDYAGNCSYGVSVITIVETG